MAGLTISRFYAILSLSSSFFPGFWLSSAQSRGKALCSSYRAWPTGQRIYKELIMSIFSQLVILCALAASTAGCYDSYVVRDDAGRIAYSESTIQTPVSRSTTVTEANRRDSYVERDEDGNVEYAQETRSGPGGTNTNVVCKRITVGFDAVGKPITTDMNCGGQMYRVPFGMANNWNYSGGSYGSYQVPYGAYSRFGSTRGVLPMGAVVVDMNHNGAVTSVTRRWGPYTQTINYTPLGAMPGQIYTWPNDGITSFNRVYLPTR